MTEAFLALFAGAVALWFLVSPLAAIIFAIKARREARAVREELTRLRRDLDKAAALERAKRAAPVTAVAEVSPREAQEPPIKAPAPEAVSPAVELPKSAEPIPMATLVEEPAKSAPFPAPANSPPPSKPLSIPAQPAAAIEWEKWFGVRGAAVLGGVVLALAGLLFFRYSIERGWLAPMVRVSLGTLAGLASLVAAERLRSRYTVTSNSLAGGGIVVLYASFWASRALYALIPMELAFVLMALTTAVACLLAVRHHSLLVALLGLAGGFATPLLLSSGSNRPIGLFGYVLLLDAGFLFIAWKRRWSVLALLALVCTALLEVAWVGKRMEPHQLLLALGILGVFALLFAGSAPKASEQRSPAERRLWLSTQAAALLLPHGFALYFASETRFGQHFFPIALLLVLLGAGASWVARRFEPKPDWLPVSMAAAQLAVVIAYLPSRSLPEALLWELVGCLVALAAVLHLFVEWPRGAPPARGHLLAAAISSAGLFVSLSAFAIFNPTQTSAWPYLTGWALFLALMLRLAARAGRPALSLSPAIALAVAYGLYRTVGLSGGAQAAALARGFWVFGIDVTFVIALYLWARAPWATRERPWVDRAAALFASVSSLFIAALASTRYFEPIEPMAGALLTGAVGLFAATRASDGRFMLLTLVTVALAHGSWAAGLGIGSGRSQALIALPLAFASALLWPAWILRLGRRFATDRFAVYTAALSLPLHFVALERLWRSGLGTEAIGALPLVLSAVSLAFLWLARRDWTEPAARYRATVWLSAAALGFVSVAIPLQLERQWITIGYAALGASTLLLWRRLDHEGLKWFALAMLAIVSVRLLLNPSVLHYADRGSLRVFNWIAYTYLLPAACLAYAAYLLEPIEVTRAKPWEKHLYDKGLPIGAALCAAAFVLVVFAWINLAVFDYFSDETRLSISLSRMPVRDLTLSIAWILYAAALLAFGMWRNSRAFRWTSLVFMLVSIGKVFLYDLGQLKDLYRVGSLVGLAISLLLISLAYQRFVFKKAGGTP